MTPDVVIVPVVSWPWFAVIAVATVALLALIAIRRGRGWLLRAGVALVLLAALLDPRIVEENRQSVPDRVVVVVDRSASQSIDDRAQATDTALARLQEALGRFANLNVQVVESGRDGDTNVTTLFSALERARAEDASTPIAALFMITDGQVHDVPGPDSPPLPAPLHVLLTGEHDQRDRVVTLTQAPAFGLVGNTVQVRFRVDDLGSATPVDGERVRVTFRVDGRDSGAMDVPVGVETVHALTLQHPSANVLEISAEPAPGEVSVLNNKAAAVVNGVRDRLRVLLVSGQPHPGERMWRNLLRSDPSVDLVHFTILRPPEKDDATPLKELSLIVFPVQELFETKLNDFDLVIFDRYRVNGVLPDIYFSRIADYVRHGGALLLSAGPEFAEPRSLGKTTLGSVLPARPTGRIFEEAFRANVSDVGRRHPVTQGLKGETVAGDAEDVASANHPAWGKWFRAIDTTVNGSPDAATLMVGPESTPILVVDRVGEGRVAEILSDHLWLWARDYDGGGPQAELLRRLAHWLMKEPELEEERLSATISRGRLSIDRHSLKTAPEEVPATVTVTRPDGSVEHVPMSAIGDGRWMGETAAPMAGIYRVENGGKTTLAASGQVNPPEFRDLRSTDARLAPEVAASGGGVAWLADGFPELRSVSPGRDAAGRGWLGLKRNHAYSVAGTSEVSLLPPWLVLSLSVAGLALAWWREGR